MSEFRRDNVLGCWIVFDPGRPFSAGGEMIACRNGFLEKDADGGIASSLNPMEKRMDFFRDEKTCPFCPGNEQMTKPEILSYSLNPYRSQNAQGWSLRVIPNNRPILQLENNLKRQADGIYDKMEGFGAHEIIVETPSHNLTFSAASLEYYENIFKAASSRIRDLGNDFRFEYIYFIKKSGCFGPHSLKHPHSQIIALPIIPKHIGDEISGALKYFNYRERCIYCDIILQETFDDARIVEENEDFISFCPYSSKYPFAVWIMPKEHNGDFSSIQNSQIQSLAKIAKKIYSKLEAVLEDCPISSILHTAPLKDRKMQHYHWHIEIIPELITAGDIDKGSGLFVNPILPEEASKILKTAV